MRKALRRLGGRHVRLARQACQEQGVRERLRVSVSELLVVGVGEEVNPPVGGERCESGVGDLQRLLDVAPKQAAQRRQQLGEPLGGGRDDRLPAEEVAEEFLQRLGVGLGDCVLTVACHVAGEAEQLPDALPVAVQRPLVAVRVEEVREVPELLPLHLVLALELLRIGALAGGLQLDVAREQPAHRHAHVRAPEDLLLLHLRDGHDGKPEAGACAFDQSADRSLELVLRIAGNWEREDVRELCRESLQQGEQLVGSRSQSSEVLLSCNYEVLVGPFPFFSRASIASRSRIRAIIPAGRSSCSARRSRASRISGLMRTARNSEYFTLPFFSMTKIYHE